MGKEAVEIIGIAKELAEIGFPAFLILELIMLTVVLYKGIPALLERYERHVDKIVKTFADELKEERDYHRGNLEMLATELKENRIQSLQESRSFQAELRQLGDKIAGG